MSDTSEIAGPVVEGIYQAKPIASNADPVDGVSGKGPLTAAETAELRKAVAEGGDAIKNFWRTRASTPATSQATTDQPATGQGADTSAAADTTVDPVKLDEHVREVAEGRVGGAEFEAVERLGRGVAEQLAKLDDAALDAAHNKTMAEVYRGDVEAYADGMADITLAAHRLCRGDATKAKELLAEIDRQRVLAHPGTHHKILSLARQIIGRRGSVLARRSAS